MAWYDSITSFIGAVPVAPSVTQWSNMLACIRDEIERIRAYVVVATTSLEGLCPKLSGVATQFLRGDGVWAAVSITDTFTIRLPASEIAQNIMTPLSMGGDGADVGKERLSNGFERWFVQFGYTDDQYACAEVLLPDGFTDDSLTITVDWETESSTLGTLVLEVYGELIDDNDLSSVALTSPIATVTDTNNGAGRRNVSAATALNPAGSGNRLLLRITRDYGTDTIEDDIKIVGIAVQGTKVITS